MSSFIHDVENAWRGYLNTWMICMIPMFYCVLVDLKSTVSHAAIMNHRSQDKMIRPLIRMAHI